MQCPQCGATVASGQRFCSNCGSALGIVCSACGTTAGPGVRFCSQCGQPLMAATVPSPVPTPRPPRGSPPRPPEQKPRPPLTAFLAKVGIVVSVVLLILALALLAWATGGFGLPQMLAGATAMADSTFAPKKIGMMINAWHQPLAARFANLVVTTPE